MGQEEERAARLAVFAGFTIDDDAGRARPRPTPCVLHCLPAHRGEEITDGVSRAPVAWSGARPRTGAPRCAASLAWAVEDAGADAATG